jgi:hypothetical protein
MSRPSPLPRTSGRRTRPIRARRDRRHRIAFLEPLERWIVLDATVNLVPIASFAQCNVISADDHRPSSCLVLEIGAVGSNPA